MYVMNMSTSQTVQQDEGVGSCDTLPFLSEVIECDTTVAPQELRANLHIRFL